MPKPTTPMARVAEGLALALANASPDVRELVRELAPRFAQADADHRRHRLARAATEAFEGLVASIDNGSSRSSVRELATYQLGRFAAMLRPDVEPDQLVHDAEEAPACTTHGPSLDDVTKAARALRVASDRITGVFDRLRDAQRGTPGSGSFDDVLKIATAWGKDALHAARELESIARGMVAGVGASYGPEPLVLGDEAAGHVAAAIGRLHLAADLVRDLHAALLDGDADARAAAAYTLPLWEANARLVARLAQQAMGLGEADAQTNVVKALPLATIDQPQGARLLVDTRKPPANPDGLEARLREARELVQGVHQVVSAAKAGGDPLDWMPPPFDWQDPTKPGELLDDLREIVTRRPSQVTRAELQRLQSYGPLAMDLVVNLHRITWPEGLTVTPWGWSALEADDLMARVQSLVTLAKRAKPISDDAERLSLDLLRSFAKRFTEEPCDGRKTTTWARRLWSMGRQLRGEPVDGSSVAFEPVQGAPELDDQRKPSLAERLGRFPCATGPVVDGQGEPIQGQLVTTSRAGAIETVASFDGYDPVGVLVLAFHEAQREDDPARGLVDLVVSTPLTPHGTRQTMFPTLGRGFDAPELVRQAMAAWFARPHAVGKPGDEGHFGDKVLAPLYRTLLYGPPRLLPGDRAVELVIRPQQGAPMLATLTVRACDADGVERNGHVVTRGDTIDQAIDAAFHDVRAAYLGKDQALGDFTLLRTVAAIDPTRDTEGVAHIGTERRRQIDKGYDLHHDLQHKPEDLAAAAIATLDGDPKRWPFTDGWQLRLGRVERYAVAGAFLAAAIDRSLEGKATP